MKKNSGVALIQVLLISAIISILAISFTHTARDQIEMATAFEQRIKAAQQLKSVQSQIIYKLLTQRDFTAEEQNQETQMNVSWNFYGEPFVIDSPIDANIVVSIQEIQGLLSQRYPNTPFWNKLLKNMGYDDEQIKQKQGLLKGWQDKDTDSWLIGDSEPEATEAGVKYPNQPIQLPNEIDWLFPDEIDQRDVVKQVSTHYSNSKFNPMNAPNRLLALLFEQPLAESLIEQRAQGLLTSDEMKEYLGDLYDSETVTTYRGGQLTITILISSETVQIQESIDILLQPYKTPAVQIIARY